jgi:carbon storage regulator
MPIFAGFPSSRPSGISFAAENDPRCAATRVAPTQTKLVVIKEGSTMLVLSRKVGERIRIGHGIVVTVLSTDGRRARIGIEAPDNVSILREELYDRTAAFSQECEKDEELDHCLV